MRPSPLTAAPSAGHRARTALVACALATVAAAAVAPAAQAATVATSPSAVTVTLTSAEASTLVAGDFGPVIGQLPPTFTPEAKQSLGQTIARLARESAGDADSTMIVVIEGPLHAPTAVSVGVLN